MRSGQGVNDSICLDHRQLQKKKTGCENIQSYQFFDYIGAEKIDTFGYNFCHNFNIVFCFGGSAK